MPYTPDKPRLTPDTAQLRAAIPGWGVDLDPANRPAAHKEDFNPGITGAHWTFPERQEPTYDRERSVEHRFLTPVFGTTCPPKGLSGLVRRYAYRFSEGRLAHWQLLVLADRIDVVESRVGALLRGRPDNLLTEMGLRTELTRHGLKSRRGQHRTDWKHVPLDPVIFMAKTGLAVYLLRAVVRATLGRPARRRRARWAWGG